MNFETAWNILKFSFDQRKKNEMKILNKNYTKAQPFTRKSELNETLYNISEFDRPVTPIINMLLFWFIPKIVS